MSTIKLSILCLQLLCVVLEAHIKACLLLQFPKDKLDDIALMCYHFWRVFKPFKMSPTMRRLGKEGAGTLTLIPLSPGTCFHHSCASHLHCYMADLCSTNTHTGWCLTVLDPCCCPLPPPYYTAVDSFSPLQPFFVERLVNSAEYLARAAVHMPCLVQLYCRA